MVAPSKHATVSIRRTYGVPANRSTRQHVKALLLPCVLPQVPLAARAVNPLAALPYGSQPTPGVVNAILVLADSTSKVGDLNVIADGDATPLIAGLAAGIALVGGAIAFAMNSKGVPIKRLSPVEAAQLLESNSSIQLVDIRTKAEIKETGTPDLRTFKKSLISSTYEPSNPAMAGGKAAGIASTVTIGWPQRLCRISKVGSDSPVMLLDADGSVAPIAAREVAAVSADREAVIIVSGGADAWQKEELPWKRPMQFGLNFDGLKGLFGGGAAVEEASSALNVATTASRREQSQPQQASKSQAAEEVPSSSKAQSQVNEDEEEKGSSGIVKGALTAAAIAGASVLLFTEVETILQIVGVVGSIQFLASRLLFAEDRQKTLDDVKYLIREKINAGTAGEDMRKLAETVLDVKSPDDISKRIADMPASKTKDGSGTVKVKVSISRPAPQSADYTSGTVPVRSSNAVKSASDVVSNGANGTGASKDSEDSEDGTVKVTGPQGVFTESGSWAPVASAGTSREGGTVPENVASARAWIDAWREEKQTGKKRVVMQ